MPDSNNTLNCHDKVLDVDRLRKEAKFYSTLKEWQARHD
jgi:hypothetical protein